MERKPPKSEAPLRDVVAALAPYERERLKAAFLARGVRALTELVDRLEPREIELAVAAKSRASTLVLALCQPGAAGFTGAERDPLMRARIRGIKRRDDLVAAEGGTHKTDEVARLLGMSPQAVHKRRAAGKLLAFEFGKRGLQFPAWQFTRDGVLAGLGEVLAAFDADVPELAIARFFLRHEARLGDRRPLDVLRTGEPGSLAAVKAAARAFDTHGAA